jgi:hypothetical protein
MPNASHASDDKPPEGVSQRPRRHALPRPSRASVRAHDASHANDDEPTERAWGAGQLEGTGEGAGQLEGTGEGRRVVSPSLSGPCGEALVPTTRYEISRGIFTLLPGDHYMTVGRTGAVVPVMNNGVLIAVAVDAVTALRFLHNLGKMKEGAEAVRRLRVMEEGAEEVRRRRVMEEGAEAVRRLRARTLTHQTPGPAQRHRHSRTTSATTPSPMRSTRPRRSAPARASTMYNTAGQPDRSRPQQVSLTARASTTSSTSTET